VRPGEKYEELHQNQLFGQTMASLAVYGESLLVRTDPMLYCVRKSTAVGFANPFSEP
jgi:hypothetical protein